jgi:hypothetical protein
MQETTDIEFRWLMGEQLAELSPIIQQRNEWVPLNPKMAGANAAYVHDTLVGFCAFNAIPHVEPLWIKETHRGSGLAETLTDNVVQLLYAVHAPAAYVIANSPHSERLALKHGMTRVEYPVYFKRGP